jgi:hypothetical protein
MNDGIDNNEKWNDLWAQKNLFCPSPRVRCYGESLGINCFWPIKDVSLKVKIISTSNILWNGDAWTQTVWRDSIIGTEKNFISCPDTCPNILI